MNGLDAEMGTTLGTDTASYPGAGGAGAGARNTVQNSRPIVITVQTSIETRSIDGPIFILSMISSDTISGN